METVLKAIADWIKGILTAGIMSNLSGLFDDVNTQVGNIAQQVGTKPSNFEPRVFAMTPYYWKTPRDGAARLAALPELTTDIAFRFLVFEKE